MNGFQREMLVTVVDGKTSHAAYPTAESTLCGVLAARVREVASALPECEECVTLAYLFRRIDRSAPAEWFIVPERSKS